MGRDAHDGTGGDALLAPAVLSAPASAGVPGSAAADVRASELEILRWRTVASIVIGAAVMVLPLFGDHRLQIGAVILLFATTSNLVLSRRVQRGASVPWLLALGDIALACTVALLVPDAYGVVTVVLVSSTGLYVFWFGPRATWRLLPVATAALLAIGLWNRPDAWIPFLIAWVVTSTFSTIIFGHVSRTLRSQRNRYDELVNGIDAAVWEGAGPSGPAEFLSDHVVDLLGYGLDQIRDAEFFTSRVHPDDVEVVLESQRLVAAGENVEVHFRVTDAWGRTRRIQNRVRVTVDGTGRVTRRRGVLVDETARWEAETSVRRYSDFVEGIPIALVVINMTDPDDPSSFVLQAANPAANAIADLDDAAIGHRIVDLIPVTDEFLDDMARVVRDGAAHDEPFVQIEGVDEVFSMRAVPLPDGCVGISLEDVTKRARMAEAFRHQATHDALTGLPNRALLHERLTRALIEGDRTGAPVALLMVDLDQFKDVNDALGHEYGDALLRELARRMSNRLRNCDTIARLGGDEFAVLLTTDATTGGAEEVARRLTELAEEPVQVGQYRLQVSASVGIAIAPEHGNDAETLMRRADGAMYDAKQTGGGHVVYCPAQEVAAVRRLELLADLREAGFTDDVEVHFQPRVDLPTMSTFGIEALVRWRHPRHGLLAPGEFIELAEVSGAIRSITQTVTVQACDALAALTGRGLSSASVNLSTRNLYDPVWVDWLCDLSHDTELVPGSLWMELTEAQLMDDPRQSADVIRRLHDVGIRFSIDDFGSGASSLALIRDLPIDEVKIDRRFVDELLAGDDRIVRSIVDVAHHLGLSVTAEGVADPTVIGALRAIGCDAAQGFALAPPMPFGELVAHLDDPHVVTVGAPGDGPADDRDAAPDGGAVDPAATAWRPAVTDR
jgi:diguanylate cyclase (GGDEF)-like protein